MADSYDFESPDFFTTGTVGTPGRRVFYLQAREGGRVVTLKLEKEQIGALAEYLAKLLADLPAPGPLPQDMALLEPVAEAWVVGSLGVAYDETADRILIVAEELTEEAEDDEDDEEDEEEGEGEGEERAEAEPPERAAPTEAEESPDTAKARFRLTRPQAAAFVERGRSARAVGPAHLPHLRPAHRSRRSSLPGHQRARPALSPRRARDMSKGPTALDLLSRGDIEVKGRLPASSNITLLVECALKGATALGGLQAAQGRAPAVGLRAGAVEARDRRLSPLRDAGLGARAPDGAARGAAR